MSAKLRIAFVSLNSKKRFRGEGSFIYRCENLSLALAAQGHQVSLLHVNELFFRQDFDVVVFLRPEYKWFFGLLVRLLRKRGITLVADVDDMLFDLDFVKFKPSVIIGKKTIKQAQRIFINSAKALALMDKVQFSTRILFDHYRRLHPHADCMVIGNAGFRTWNAIVPKPARGEPALLSRNITYLSGTRTHDRDFATVAPVLKRLLERHPDLTLRLVGPLAAEVAHPRVVRLPKFPFSEYADVVRDSYILIAPLEDTPFNRCKSALKAIEGGMMNVPTVASPLPESEFAEMEKAGVFGILFARTEAEWEAQLEYALIPENHQRLSAGLRERMRAYTDIDEHARRFVQFVTS